MANKETMTDGVAAPEEHSLVSRIKRDSNFLLRDDFEIRQCRRGIDSAMIGRTGRCGTVWVEYDEKDKGWIFRIFDEYPGTVSNSDIPADLVDITFSWTHMIEALMAFMHCNVLPGEEMNVREMLEFLADGRHHRRPEFW